MLRPVADVVEAEGKALTLRLAIGVPEALKYFVESFREAWISFSRLLDVSVAAPEKRVGHSHAGHSQGGVPFLQSAINPLANE